MRTSFMPPRWVTDAELALLAATLRYTKVISTGGQPKCFTWLGTIESIESGWLSHPVVSLSVSGWLAGVFFDALASKMIIDVLCLV